MSDNGQLGPSECFSLCEDITNQIGAAVDEVTSVNLSMCNAMIRLQREIMEVEANGEVGARECAALAAVKFAGKTEESLAALEANIGLAHKASGVLLRNLEGAWQILSRQWAAADRRASELEARLKEHSPSDAAVRELVWQITGGLCFYCSVDLVKASPLDPSNPGSRGNVFHVDHIVPKHLGGPDHISNFVPACHSCNSSKGAKSFAEFTRKRQAQLSVIEGGAAKEGTNG